MIKNHLIYVLGLGVATAFPASLSAQTALEQVIEHAQDDEDAPNPLHEHGDIGALLALEGMEHDAGEREYVPASIDAEGDEIAKPCLPSLQPGVLGARHGQITAALTRRNGRATYLFYSDGCYNKTSAGLEEGFDPGYPKRLPGGWQQIPKDWQGSIQAAMPFDGTTRNYMWRDGEYILLADVDVDERNFPKKWPGGWRSIAPQWGSKADAAFHFPPDRKNYIFSGDEFIRLAGTKMDPGYPKKIRLGWKNLPEDFHSDIDAATYRDGHLYLIKGYEYVRLDGDEFEYRQSMDYWPAGPKNLPVVQEEAEEEQVKVPRKTKFKRKGER